MLLEHSKCQPCENIKTHLTPDEVKDLMQQITGWSLSADGRWMYKSFTMEHFSAAIDFINAIAKIAENEDHHPDIHLSDYRHIKIELTTHALGGLTRNDFILAAKIDMLPKDLKG